jgi:hypothetical protein
MSLERVGSRWLPLGWVLRSLVIINIVLFRVLVHVRRWWEVLQGWRQFPFERPLLCDVFCGSVPFRSLAVSC